MFSLSPWFSFVFLNNEPQKAGVFNFKKVQIFRFFPSKGFFGVSGEISA